MGKSLGIGTHTRDHIVATAASVFAVTGFRSTTIRDIAEKANVNEITIYRHFSTKLDLYKSAIGWKIESARIGSQLCSVIGTQAASTDTLRRVLLVLIETLLDNRELSRLLMYAALEFGTEAQFDGEFRHALESLLSYMAECQRTGILIQGDCVQATSALVAMAVGHFTYLNFLSGRESTKTPQEYASGYVELWLSGLLNSSATA
jgi:AcrR family transcriptional regulator